MIHHLPDYSVHVAWPLFLSFFQYLDTYIGYAFILCVSLPLLHRVKESCYANVWLHGENNREIYKIYIATSSTRRSEFQLERCIF